MTTEELVTFLRENLLDDTGGQNVEWKDFSNEDYDSIQLRWTNEELIANINEAITQVYKRSNPIQDIITLSVSAGEDSISLPFYVKKILGMRRDDGISIKEKDIDEFFELPNLNKKQGAPLAFFSDYKSNLVKFYPIPTADLEILVRVYRYPKVKLSWDNRDYSPELREEYQIPMLSYAAGLCYLKDEANTLDPTRANTFLNMFDREFPFTSVYSDIRKSRTSNRVIRYGGY